MEETCQIRIQDIVDIETATLKIPSITISDQWGQRSVLPSCDVQPLNLIALDQPVKVKAIGGGVVDQEFTLKRFRKGYYVCSCPSFRFNREKRKFEKSCSHLVSHLGEVYEKRRVGLVRYFSTGEEEEEEEGGGGGGGLWKRVSSAQARQSHAKAFLSQRDSSAQSSGSFKDREGLKRNEELEEGGNPRGEESKNKVKVGGGREEAYNEGMVLESNSNKRSKPNNCLPNSILGDREEVDGSSGSETEEEVALPLKSRNHLPGTNSSPSNSRAKQRSIPTSSPSKRKKREEDQEDPVKLLLAKPWILEDDPNEKKKKKAMDPEGWWVSEKLDGVRAFWDGERLWSRQQLEWNAPSWWKDRLPKDITLDGELWMARGTFDQTSQICRTSVRMGRLETFQHHLERSEREREWLNEQLGGRITVRASRRRLYKEAQARREIESKRREGSNGFHRLLENLDLDGGADGEVGRGRVSGEDGIVGEGGGGGGGREGSRRGRGKRRPSSWKSFKRENLRVLTLTRSSSGSFSTWSTITLAPSSSSTPATPSIHHASRGAKSGRGEKKTEKRARCPRCSRGDGSRHPAKGRREGIRNWNDENWNSTEHSTRTLSSSSSSSSSLVTRSGPGKPLASLPTNTFAALLDRTAPQPPPITLSASDPSLSLPTWRSDVKRSTEWHQIKFMIFDAPSMAMRPVEQRWEELRRRFGDTERVEIDRLEGPCIKLVHHVKCRGRQHLIELLNEVEAKGGEGLMLRESGSRYEFRRGNTLYKLKTFHDAEAVVVGYAPGEGRNSNRTGALICRMENGTLFRVGSGLSDSMRSNPPPKGMVINYRFQQLSEEGYPRFPSFRGVAWDKSVAKDA
ncbi:hypothetical protein IE53DRAFT_378908 [Violaceomyces palustris]|uniref:Uncharacterized protein n=1 Tax=Violaceomyces palustris TaxID=1673888 RepID=A0ACD0P078_9BASI|nr:hypothetical protein IE53DRAFT_378908 [Violaceomyces palustris]